MFLRKAWMGWSALAVLAIAGGAAAQPPNLTALHDALHLTAEQEPTWAAYKASVSSPQTQQRRRSAAQLFPTLTAPRRIDLVEAEMRQDLDDLHRQGQALKAFYAALSPQQQKTFDAQTLPPPPSQNDRGED
jgi:hypothetical protein